MPVCGAHTRHVTSTVAHVAPRIPYDAWYARHWYLRRTRCRSLRRTRTAVRDAATLYGTSDSCRTRALRFLPLQPTFYRCPPPHPATATPPPPEQGRKRRTGHGDLLSHHPPTWPPHHICGQGHAGARRAARASSAYGRHAGTPITHTALYVLLGLCAYARARARTPSTLHYTRVPFSAADCRLQPHHPPFERLPVRLPVYTACLYRTAACRMHAARSIQHLRAAAAALLNAYLPFRGDLPQLIPCTYTTAWIPAPWYGGWIPISGTPV